MPQSFGADLGTRARWDRTPGVSGPNAPTVAGLTDPGSYGLFLETVVDSL